MNIAELKLDMFRRIDNLSQADLEKVYSQFLELINTTSEYKLSDIERDAIESALLESEKGNTYTRQEIVSEAKVRYPKLKFK